LTGQRLRRLGIAVAVLVLALGAVLASSVSDSHDRALRRAVLDLSEIRRAAAREWIEEQLKALEHQAAAAAALPGLRGAVAAFDPSAFRGGFPGEPWWEPFRRGFDVAGIALAGEHLDAAYGLPESELRVGELLHKARAARVGARMIRAGPEQRPFLVAAAAVELPRPSAAADLAQPAAMAAGPAFPAAPVLLLGRAVEQPFLDALAEKLGGAVLISDGRKVLLAAGQEQAVLASAVGEERAGSFAAADGSWRAAAQRFAPGLVLWTYAALDEGAASALQANALTGTAVVWGGTLLVAAAAVLLARGAARAKETADAASAEVAAPLEIGEDADSPERAPSEPLAASLFGGYLLLDRLAAGGKAEVYSAVSAGPERLRRPCVVKRLRPEVARRPEAISSFVSEARLASVLVHANVVPVFEFGKAGDEYFLAQEYVIGRDLGRVVRRSLEKDQKPLPTLQAFYVAQQTLLALEYAHGRLGDRGAPLGLVHRDVSPNNILVSARGEVKLFDFGIARQSGPTPSSDGIVQGNVRFMSPEQARAEAVDARSDLFALGLVLYYALAGKSLYDAEDGYALLLQAAQGPAEAQLQRIEALPESAAAIVTRALKPDPAQRFQTAGEFAAALAGGAGQRPALARTMDRLFAADLAQEEARFLAALARGQARREPLSTK
jgi:hypothetical protein